MKKSDGFDARRLRPKSPGNWRFRFATTFSALLTLAGVLLAMMGAVSLLGHPPALGELNTSPAGAVVVLLTGLLLLYVGVRLWRRCRRRMRQPQGLNLAPHLMRKHD